MTKDQIQSLVNKGAITHVGVAADLETMADKEICDKFITKHEVAAEVLVGENTELETPVEVAPIEPKKATKKSKKAASPIEEAPVEETNEAPVVDPVE